MRIQRILFSFLLASAFLQFGCSTIYSRGPMAIVESPEVASSDKWRMNLNMQLAPEDFTTLSNDAAARPPAIMSNPQMGQGYTAYVGPSMSTPSAAEFGLSIDPLATVLAGGVGAVGYGKYQLIGPTYDKYEPHSHLLGVATHVSYNSQSTGGNQKYLGGDGGYPWNANSHFTGVDVGMTYGFRQSHFWMYYLGYAYQSFSVDADLHQGAASNGSSAGGSYFIPNSQGTNQKTSVGVLMGGDFFKLDMQVGYISTRWNQQVLNEPTASLGVSFHFGSSPVAATPAVTPVVPVSETTPQPISQ